MRHAGIAILTVLGLIGCGAYHVEITRTDAAAPTFQFQYRKAADEPVLLYSVTLRETATGELVWQVATFRQSFTEDDRGSRGNRDFNGRERQKARDSALVLRSIRLGIVPEGFMQLFPESATPPTLQSKVKYTLFVDGGDGNGSLSFELP